MGRGGGIGGAAGARQLEMSVRTTIVSGADSKYFAALRNLVGSVHYWMPETAIIIFDLGLKQAELAEAARWDNCEVRWASLGPPITALVDGRSARRPHIRKLRVYAWKPVAIVAAMELHDRVLWVDAGSDLRGPIGPIEEILGRDGYFLVKGQDLDMTAKLHGGCLRRLSLRREDFRGKPSFGASTQGYVKGSRAAKEILFPTYSAACDARCIAPLGSGLWNHRYDQSILSLIAYSRTFPVKDQTHLLSAHREELSADSLKPSTRLIYTARGSSQDYVNQIRKY